jgi:16S rRNA G966 N2-methylase RsmD
MSVVRTRQKNHPFSRARKRFRRWLRRHIEPWRQASFGGVRVHYKECLDGGGSWFGQDFIPFLRSRGMPQRARVFEWCAGPGFIGFSMLGHGLCESLCLADVNPKAVAACRRTIADNGLGGQVSVYHSDNLSAIPASEQWDLVVSNPPHYDDASVDWLRSYDKGWRLHREFFTAIGRFLRPGGVIVLQENNQGSTAETFRDMIEEAGLAVVFVHGCAPQPTRDPRFYYIGMMRRGEAAPVWASGEIVESTPAV